MDTKTTWQTVFLIGAPAAGKTTIGRAAATRLHGTFRSIDDWTPRGQPMTDAQIDDALQRLLTALAPSGELAEFAHHDYLGLLANDACRLFAAGRKIIVTAPLAACLARNRARLSPVREAYVERAWHSTEAIIERLATGPAHRSIVVDTCRTTPDDAVAGVAEFAAQGR